MKNIILILVCSIAFGLSLLAQNSIDSVLVQIERNNTTLSALQRRAEAEKIGNKTGNYLQNPEFELNYLWGSPSQIGNRSDIIIKQSFDFPTAYRYKHQISTIRNEQVELAYQKQRKELLLESRLICYDLIYINGLIAQLSLRQIQAQSIASSYKLKLDAGETNILEYNKAQLNLLNLSKEIESLTIEKEALLGELTRLNGGIYIEFTASEFQVTLIPVDFEQWYLQAEQSNPLLIWLKREVELNKKQVSLNKVLSWPKFKAGYMSESLVGQDFRGISVGMSIPLRENKNTVKYAMANTQAIENAVTNQQVMLYYHLKSLHTKATALQNNALDYKTKLQLFNNSELLKKALDKGEISLINYMVELSIYHESIKNLLDMERDMNKSLAELNQYLQ